MRRNLFIIFILCIVAVSCQKELSDEFGVGAGSGTNLLGTWKFVGTSATGNSDNLIDVGGFSTRTTSNYAFTSYQNTGTISFGADGKAISNNFGYAVDTTAWVLTYFDGVFADSTEVDIVYPYAASSATTDYIVKGADSILFKNGSLAGSQDGTMGYKITGNKLQLAYLVKIDSTISELGVTGYAKQQQTTYFNYEK